MNLFSADIFFPVQNLPVQITECHLVMIDDPNRSYSGGGQVKGDRRTEPSGTRDDHS
jgi:hypothetical protein